ncbi:MAG: hypothetical protein FIA89_02725 [Geobacter sp.]|nr:hypothetical protein [Geobacter sp.]
MTKQQLLDQATALPAISAAAACEYARNQPGLAEAGSSTLLLRPDIEQLIGTGNQAMMEDNHRNHGRFIASLLQAFSPEILVETILWVFGAYRSHGFQPGYWPVQLQAWLQLLPQHLSAASLQEIAPLYRYMLAHQPDFADLSDPAHTTAGADHA